MAASTPLIPPVAVGDFTCAGNGLLYEEHARESPAQLRALILPSGDKNGISDRDKPKAWWLAQNKFYGLAQAKATPIGTLRSKLEEALLSPNGMTVPEKILNLESEGNRKYQDLLQLVLQETQKGKKQPSKASTSKAKDPPKPKEPKAPAVGTSKQAAAQPPKASSSAKKKVESKNTTARKPSEKSNASTAIPPSAAKVAKGKNASIPQNQASASGSTIPASDPEKPKIPEFTKDPDVWEVPGPAPRPKQTARKPIPTLPRKKRERSPSDMDVEMSSKRLRSDEDTEFAWLTGTYRITETEGLEEWPTPENMELAVRLDSDKRLFAAFDFYIVEGVIRSSTDIQSRADGAAAKVEWCGREGVNFEGTVHPPSAGMKGTLRFTRKRREGRHLLKGTIEDVSAIGKLEFSAERISEMKDIRSEWEDYSRAAYEEANQSRWH